MASLALLSTGSPIFRAALLLEASANLISGISMILNPQMSADYMLTHPTLTTEPTLNCIQIFGCLAIALATPLVMAYPNTVKGVGSRYIAYATLGAGEAMMVGLCAWLLVVGGSGFTDGFLVAAVGVLGAIGVGRAVVCLGFPEWVGEVREGKRSD